MYRAIFLLPNIRNSLVMKAFILAILMAASFPSFAEPVAIDVPIVIISREEFDQMSAEVKKLYEAYAALVAQKSCKKT